jgi:hypothetical protein
LNVTVGVASQLSVAVAEPVLAGAVLAEHWIVIFAGQVITGAELSSTRIVCVHELEFPQSSVAIHVLEMVRSCGHAPPVMISVKPISSMPSQLSVAVAEPVAAGNVFAVQAMVTFAGQVITGGVSSWTSMSWRQVLELPQSSVDVHVLVIVCSTGQTPSRTVSLKVTVGLASQLSVAVALPVTAGNGLWSHCIVIFEGHVITGGKLSSTSMICRHVLELPQSSVARHVRLIVLSCGHAPAIVASVKVTVGVTSQLSVAVADPVFAGAVLAVHKMVTFPGQVMDGATLSSTMMVW